MKNKQSLNKLKERIEYKKHSYKELRHSVRLFKGIFNNAAAGIALLDKDGYYKHVNATLCRLVGYSEEELKLMKFHDITFSLDLERSVRMCEGIWTGLYPWVSCEKRYICKNGDILWTEINMSAIHGEDQEITDVIVVVLDITARKKMEQELIKQANTDFLTGVDNRLAFMHKAQEEFNRAKRYPSAFSLLLLDIDNFKSVNDVHGHLVGDRVLQEVVTAFRTVLRDTDILARIGGEEFAIILIETDRKSALQVALRIQQRVKDLIIEVGEKQIRVTVSIGISLRKEGDKDLDEIFKRADDALYKAKNSGKNMIIVENDGKLCKGEFE